MHTCAGRRQSERVVTGGFATADHQHLARTRMLPQKRTNFVEQMATLKAMLSRDPQTARLSAAGNNDCARQDDTLLTGQPETIGPSVDTSDFNAFDAQTKPVEVLPQSIRETRSAQGLLKSGIVLDAEGVLDQAARDAISVH